MRELLLKNLTSREKKRKLISVSETLQKNGFLTQTNRHFVYLVKESKVISKDLAAPLLYILRVHDSKQKKERVFFKVKGNFYVVTDSRIYNIFFCHSFKIELSQMPQASPANPL